MHERLNGGSMAHFCNDISGISGGRKMLCYVRGTLLLAFLAISLTACKPVGWQDARERNNRLIAQAYELIDAGSYDAAAKLLREALDTFPTMARPHLDLALIQHDHKQHYVRAIYHYERYLALRPGSEKEEMIQGRVSQARKQLLVQLRNEMGDTVAVQGDTTPAPENKTQENVVPAVFPDGQKQENLIAQLEKDLSEMRVTLAERERVLDARLGRITELENATRQLRQQLVWARSEQTSENPVAPDVAVASEDATAAAAGKRTYAVRANDSLSVIAKRVYGDATKWRVIQDANREVLGDSEMLRIGQILEIPELEERR